MASGSGALTLGYSPVNSFGNVSIPASRRENSMMLVGGPDLGATSPSQPLGMYRSYSGGVPKPLDDSHMRMSVGSFGGPTMAYSRSYGAEYGAPSEYAYSAPPVRAQEGAGGGPPFYSFLRRYRAAFQNCTFVLPGLKATLLEASMSEKESPTTSLTYGALAPQDLAIARRRIESSIFAFGGNPSDGAPRSDKVTEMGEIFRATKEGSEAASSQASPGGSRIKNRPRSKYEEELPDRYYENDSRLSWEFEETPPIIITKEDEDDNDNNVYNQTEEKRNEGDEGEENKDQDNNSTNQTIDPDNQSRSGNDADAKQSGSTTSAQPKMRYRCKLCGQPKQNHTCPFQQSLARSIGVMIFPAVNAFTANEPGSIAPPLSEMNNFVEAKEISSNDSSPSRPSPDRTRRVSASVAPPSSTTQVTPESMRSGHGINSPSSTFASTPGRTASRRGSGRPNLMAIGNRKRPFSHFTGGADDQSDLLFMESVELKPEQFRVVSPSKALTAPGAYSYPSLPLPYAQRKRLSDNLFSLSNEVPKLTDECAQVLREAREKDMWDLAVAELMTQVVVIIHCSDNDSRFEGLRQYLLTLGVAC
jgi:hypothetical protein